MLFAPQAKDVQDEKEVEGPTKMVENPSDLALKYMQDLEDARINNDGERMSNIVFDADCDDMANQIDLNWYEQRAAQLLQNEEMWIKKVKCHLSIIK